MSEFPKHPQFHESPHQNPKNRDLDNLQQKPTIIPLRVFPTLHQPQQSRYAAQRKRRSQKKNGPKGEKNVKTSLKKPVAAGPDGYRRRIIACNMLRCSFSEDNNVEGSQKQNRVSPIRGANEHEASSENEEAAERAFEAQAEKDRTLMRLEELRFLATSTKDLDEDDAYWIKKQKN
ncbi:hypothetical protein Tco_1228296 [Tanacetum coccineum]